jgi:hypothetical protein
VPDTTSRLDFILSNPRRFGFDRIIRNDYDQTVIFNAYGRNISMDAHLLYEERNVGRLLRDTLKRLEVAALEGLRQVQEGDVAVPNFRSEAQRLMHLAYERQRIAVQRNAYKQHAEYQRSMMQGPAQHACTGFYFGGLGCMETAVRLVGQGVSGDLYLQGSEEALVYRGNNRLFPTKPKKVNKKLARKSLKAEAKAQELIKELAGTEQWEVYRRTMRVITKPNKFFWIIGDVFGKYNKFQPFAGKPDVVRIDNDKKLYATSFCVDQRGGEETPYTDKVVAFLTHLIHDEKEFIKIGNRIDEHKFNKMKECAVIGHAG